MNNGEILEVVIKEKKEKVVIGDVDGDQVFVRARDFDLLEVGKSFFSFVYLNRHDELCADINIPRATLKSFGRGEVKTIDHTVGVFVDIGLIDKDILVSLDDLPDNSRDWPQVGDELIIRLTKDNKYRLWGKLATDEDMLANGFINSEHAFKRNETVSGIVYHLGKNGAFILLDLGRFAYLHHTEIAETVHLGQRLTGRIIGFGAHDRINISLLKNAYARIDDDAAMILAAIKFNPKKELHLTDSAAPKAIKEQLGISKASFKRAVGHLLKKNLISEENGYLKIKDQSK